MSKLLREVPETKVCTRCKRVLLRSAFPVRRVNGYGVIIVQSWCIVCKNAYCQLSKRPSKRPRD